jgi:hypothetical protein
VLITLSSGLEVAQYVLKRLFASRKMSEPMLSIPAKIESEIMNNTIYSSLHVADMYTDYGSLRSSVDNESAENEDPKEEYHSAVFSWSEYCRFFAIGMSMMWTW